jgi:hypothetical protein
MTKLPDPKEKYNGFTNWDTWNCSLHLSNEEDLYNCAKLMRKPRNLKAMWLQLMGYGFDDIRIRYVNWQEVFDHLNEE